MYILSNSSSLSRLAASFQQREQLISGGTACLYCIVQSPMALRHCLNCLCGFVLVSVDQPACQCLHNSTDPCLAVDDHRFVNCNCLVNKRENVLTKQGFMMKRLGWL